MKHARDDYNRIQDPANKIPADEPVFLLRGQDKAAPEAVRRWAAMAAHYGASADIVAKAKDQATLMEAWQATQAGKVPDLPA